MYLDQMCYYDSLKLFAGLQLFSAKKMNERRNERLTLLFVAFKRENSTYCSGL